MTLTYLNQSGSAVVGANGTANVVLRPDVGQWWQCSFVRVSTVNQSPPVAYAAVYHGSTAAIGPTTFVDDTFQANNDSSTIVSGLVVQFGDAIIVQFKNAKPGDTVIATIYGQSSDVPGEFKLLSPGTHFAGHASAGVTSVVINDEAGTFANFPATTIRSLGFVGNFGYLGIRFESDAQNFDVAFDFFADAGYTSLLNTFTFDVNGTFGFFGGSIPVGGPYCRVTITASAAGAQFDFKVWSTAHEFTTQTRNADDSVLLSGESIQALVGDNVLNTQQSFPGNAMWSVSSLLTTWSATLYAVDLNGNRIFLHKTDNSTGLPRRQIIQVYLPAMSITTVFNNGTAAAGNYNQSLVVRPWTPGR